MNSSPESVSLSDELGALQQAIRGDAANTKLRIHLFQLLCVTGQWQRALSQLQLCGQMDVKSLPMAQTYREAIRMEALRAEVFAGKRAPQVMGQPPKWIGPLLEALKVESTGDIKAASELRKRAMDEADPRPCTVDGVACEWLCDGDARIGPVIEIIANGQYYWLPFESCQGISIEAPVDLRDLVWAPGEVMLPNEGRIPVLIPTRYPGTEAVDNDALRRSRATEWKEIDTDSWTGLGQRTWMSDVGEHPLLNTRLISFVGDSISAATSS
jgi:type VI secretion system protein ImpE